MPGPDPGCANPTWSQCRAVRKIRGHASEGPEEILTGEWIQRSQVCGEADSVALSQSHLQKSDGLQLMNRNT